MAPGVGKTEAPAIGLSKLNSMAFRLAVYASPDGLPTYDARLASGAGQALPDGLSTRKDSYERFQICFYISFPFPKLAWRNPTRRGSQQVDLRGFELLSDCVVELIARAYCGNCKLSRLQLMLDKSRYPALRSGLGKTHGVAEFLLSATG